MNVYKRQNGFTLVEVMLAAGILAIGLVLIAGAFPFGVSMTAKSAEQTIAPIVADEAFAKIRLNSEPVDLTLPWGVKSTVLNVDLYSGDSYMNFQAMTHQILSDDELSWPSVEDVSDNRYCWSALLRYNSATDSADAIVFVSRITGLGVFYPDPANVNDSILIPKPISVGVASYDQASRTITISDASLLKYIADDAVLLMADNTGTHNTMILNVREVDRLNNKVAIEQQIDGSRINSVFWVIPAAKGSTRNPCIGVFTEQIFF